MQYFVKFFVAAQFLIVGCSPLLAHVDPKARQSLTSTEKPPGTEGIGIEEKLGDQLDLQTLVRNEHGLAVPLKSFFSTGKPVIFSLVYYSCPGLCNFHLNGLIDSLKKLDWTAGREFELVVLSFDPKEDSSLGVEKKKSYMGVYNRPDAESGVHFLTASAESIGKLTSQVGFRYKWNEQAQEWAHASAAIVVSPDGKITRYLHGIIFDTKDVRLALTEGGQGKVGSFIDQMIWYCFKYDPQKSKYSFYAFRLVQLGGGLIVLVLATLLYMQWGRRRNV